MRKERGSGKLATVEPKTALRERRLNRFAEPFRDRIAALTAAAPWAEDLAETFPALLFALVSDYATAGERTRAFEAVLNGDPLKEAAQRLGLPLWLRRLPAEAFNIPLTKLPDHGPFAARIANFVPDAPEGARQWLNEVSLAYAVGDETFALWVARQSHAIPANRRGPLFLHLAAWQWYARHPETDGHRLIDHPWSPKMGVRRASEEMTRWRRRADLACLIGDGIETSWLEPATVRGYEFVALKTLGDFLEEARHMHNCLDQYADRLGTGAIRVFSIRRKGRPVADLEVGPLAPDTGRPTIIQLKAPRNRRASAAVWSAAEAWCRAQPVRRLARRPGPVSRGQQGERRGAFWAPFLAVLPESHRPLFEASVLFVAHRPVGPTAT